MVLGPLLVAGSQTAELLKTVDEPFDAVALAVDGPVKASPMLITAMGNGDTNAAPASVGTQRRIAVAFVTDDAMGTQSRPTAALTFDGSLLQQGRKDRGFMALAWGQHHGHQLATPFGAEVDLGGEAALTVAEGFRFRVPPFAPAAWGWARMMVPST